MTNHQTHDLLGDPLPEPLPEGVRLTDIHELAGHTIKAVFEGMECKQPADLVIVTETRCWMALQAVEDGPDNTFIGDSYGTSSNLGDFVAATDLLQAGCITGDEHVVLKAAEDKTKAEEQARHAAYYRRKLAELEGNKA